MKEYVAAHVLYFMEHYFYPISAKLNMVSVFRFSTVWEFSSGSGGGVLGGTH